jgi:hypothetical protein
MNYFQNQSCVLFYQKNTFCAQLKLALLLYDFLGPVQHRNDANDMKIPEFMQLSVQTPSRPTCLQQADENSSLAAALSESLMPLRQICSVL